MALMRQAKAADDFGLLAEAIPYMRSLGIQVRAGEGALITTLRADPKLTGNPWLPALHGGVIGGVLETAAILQLLYEQEVFSNPEMSLKRGSDVALQDPDFRAGLMA